MFHAQSSVLGGEQTREVSRGFDKAVLFLGQLNHRWKKFSHYQAMRYFGVQGYFPTWNLFVLEQLGLIEVRAGDFPEKERKYWGGLSWIAGAARLTAWGMAVTWVLVEMLGREYEEEDKAFAGDADLSKREVAEGQGNVEGWDESPDESVEGARFGVLQPVFQPYFPEWRTVYAHPDRDARSGIHIFKVTLTGWRGKGGGIWRRLAAPSDTSLDELAEAILSAFKLDRDHMYDFRYRDQRGRSRVYNHPYCDDGPWTSEVTVGESDLAIRGEMQFTFDYGDYWQFDVRLESVDDGDSLVDQPELIESAGKAPEQYPSYEE